MAVDQEGFRFFADGSEAGSVALALQDTNVFHPLSTNIILRLLLNGTGDPPSQAYRLDYKKSTDGAYAVVPTTSTTAGAIPTFQAAGTADATVNTTSPAWPAHQANDIGLLLIESCGGEAATLSTASGFAAVTNSPSATGTTTNGTRITAFWCRATSSAMAAPIVADPGNHAYSRILTFRGCITTGNPWDVTAAAQKASASTSASAPTVTTTVANTLIVNIISRDNDLAGAAFSAWANASLTNVTEHVDDGDTSGNGGGFAVASGGKATAGATGVTTATVTSTINASLTIALKPEPTPVPIFVSPSANIAASGENTTARLDAPAGKTTADFVAGRRADDENPLDAIDITTDDYTEVAWCLQAQTPAVNGEIYQFRVTVGGVALDTYSVTPQWTIGSGISVPVLMHSHMIQSGYL